KLSGGKARFEVSTNGGFDWVTTGLGTNNNGFVCPNTPTVPSGLNNASPAVTCNPIQDGGTFWPTDSSGREDLTVWQRRQHNLTSYRNSGLIYIRFNLQTPSSSVSDGWYITDITI